MTVLLSPFSGAGQQFFDNNGLPLSGGKIYSYLAGTNTAEPTYSTSTGLIPHSNPITLDAAGRVPSGEIWLLVSTSYKFVLKTAAGILLGTYDNIIPINDASQTIFTGFKGQVGTVESLAGDDGADWIGYTPPGAGAVPESVADKLAQTVSVKDFGAVGDGSNATTAFQAAIAEVNANGKNLYVPEGTYALTSGLTVPEGVCIEFASGVVINYTAASGNIFTVEKNAVLLGNGTYINATNASWTDAVFYVDGAQQFLVQSTKIDGFTLTGPLTTNQNGIGVLIVCTNPGDYVAFVRFSNISFFSLDFAFYVSMPGSGSPNDCYVNGNFFENLSCWNTNQFFYVTGASSAISTFQGNILNGLQYQTNNLVSGRIVLEFIDGCLDNQITNLMIWDWTGAVNPIKFVGSSAGNKLVSNIDPFAASPNGITGATLNYCENTAGKIGISNYFELSANKLVLSGTIDATSSNYAANSLVPMTEALYSANASGNTVYTANVMANGVFALYTQTVTSTNVATAGQYLVSIMGTASTVATVVSDAGVAIGVTPANKIFINNTSGGARTLYGWLTRVSSITSV